MTLRSDRRIQTDRMQETQQELMHQVEDGLGTVHAALGDDGMNERGMVQVAQEELWLALGVQMIWPYLEQAS